MTAQLKPCRRDRLAEAQNHRCCYCGVRFGLGDDAPTLEHVHPRSHGGSNALSNLVVACCRCNTMRGTEGAYRFFERRGWDGRLTRSDHRRLVTVWNATRSPAPRATLADALRAAGVA